MRKELVIYLDTTEPDIEYSIRLLKVDNNCIVITHENTKFACNIQDLQTALNELNKFKVDNVLEEVPQDLKVLCEDFSYGDTNEK